MKINNYEKGRKDMIDLHMHTKYSDGTDSVQELLSNATKTNLDTISITDHNTCNAYEEMEKYNVSEFYNGNIIVGCEFTTSFDNRLIEVLGYGFDYKKVNEYLNNYYTPELVNERTTTLYNRLIEKIKDIGLIFNLEDVREKKFANEFFERGIYDELIKHPENFELLKEDIWNSFSDFFRKGLTNPNSKLFINHAEFKPSLKEIINLVHDNGGIVFLAHAYQYKFDDTEEFLNKIYDENNFDGVECFYTTFSKKQSQYLFDFAGERNLLISGGSDYHGLNKKQHDLGIGSGNLNINNDIISNWNVGFYDYEKIRYAVRVFAFNDNKVLCIKYKNLNKDFFDIPGGKIEDGETEIQTCIREFKEETGMDIDDLKCIGKVSIIYPNKKYIMKTYIANKINGIPQEFDDNYSYWVPISELTKNEKRFAITHLIDDDLIKYFESEKLNITFTCDENHNIINMEI